jgi:heptosyltransferase-1
MRILIIKLGSIGDIVHALPAASVLRGSFPDAHISWVVDTRSSAILKGSPAIDRLIELDTKSWNGNLLSRNTLRSVLLGLREIRGKDGVGPASSPYVIERDADHTLGGLPDIAIDFQGLIKSGAIALLSGAVRRIGCETADLRESESRAFLTEQFPTAHIPHVIGKNLHIARAVAQKYGVADIPIKTSDDNTRHGGNGLDFPLLVTAEDEHYADTITGNSGPLFGIINPGGAWRTKLWHPNRYAKIADWLWLEHGIRTFATFGPGEQELADSVASASATGTVTPIGPTLKQFVALARRAALFIGGDTGPLHLAAACRTPIVGLYGPTGAARNGPFDPRDLVVGRDLWCRPDCHRRRCWHWECMDIPVDVVKRAVTSRLARCGGDNAWAGPRS